ncbi:GMC oxidoreductase [Mycolicibacterium sp. Dal123E01]|uniref:GMC oxidoreductase n=1 Tax=Mycolicibacterium sp. Dal123E01 TaxID=3457578 RepID=UPI00403E8B6A
MTDCNYLVGGGGSAGCVLADRLSKNPKPCVNGVEGLRVADTSVMPMILSANPNATVLAIAEKAAELLCPQTH